MMQMCCLICNLPTSTPSAFTTTTKAATGMAAGIGVGMTKQHHVIGYTLIYCWANGSQHMKNVAKHKLPSSKHVFKHCGQPETCPVAAATSSATNITECTDSSTNTRKKTNAHGIMARSICSDYK
jgi:hypothetical protein